MSGALSIAILVTHDGQAKIMDAGDKPPTHYRYGILPDFTLRDPYSPNAEIETISCRRQVWSINGQIVNVYSALDDADTLIALREQRLL